MNTKCKRLTKRQRAIRQAVINAEKRMLKAMISMAVAFALASIIFIIGDTSIALEQSKMYSTLVVLLAAGVYMDLTLLANKFGKPNKR